MALGLTWTQRGMEKHYLQLLLNIFRESEISGVSKEAEAVKVLRRSRKPSSRSEQVWLSELVVPALLDLGHALAFPFSGPSSPSSFELQ